MLVLPATCFFVFLAIFSTHHVVRGTKSNRAKSPRRLSWESPKPPPPPATEDPTSVRWFCLFHCDVFVRFHGLLRRTYLGISLCSLEGRMVAGLSCRVSWCHGLCQTIDSTFIGFTQTKFEEGARQNGGVSVIFGSLHKKLPPEPMAKIGSKDEPY